MIKFLLDYSSGVPVYRQIIDQIIFWHSIRTT